MKKYLAFIMVLFLAACSGTVEEPVMDDVQVNVPQNGDDLIEKNVLEDGDFEESLVSLVNIEGFTFNPGTITVSAGDSVEWINMDSAPHRIKLSTEESDNLLRGGVYQTVFNVPGTYDYECGIHSSMKGTVIVE